MWRGGGVVVGMRHLLHVGRGDSCMQPSVPVCARRQRHVYYLVNGSGIKNVCKVFKTLLCKTILDDKAVVTKLASVL